VKRSCDTDKIYELFVSPSKLTSVKSEVRKGAKFHLPEEKPAS
jgi:hypothetical protein